jgi:hypothetical protein
VVLTIDLPTHPPSPLAVIQRQTEVPLEAAEVGEVTIPIACTAEARPAVYTLPLTVGVEAETRGLYIRSQKSEGQLGETLLSFTTGMALSTSMGLGFVARTQADQELPLRVEGEPQPGAAPDLTPTFCSHWTVADLAIQGKARTYVNDQRLYLLPALTRPALYKAFLDESRERYRDAGLQLHLGEAIFLAKILTGTAEYFLKHTPWQDALLLPAYTLAYRHGLPVNDPVLLITRADYARLTRLAMSLSFGLLRQHAGQDVWSMEEQLAVAELVADRVERGGILPAEFLYLPLLLGGLLIGGQFQMPGEKPGQSLDLLAKARQQRDADLAENAELVALFDQLLQAAQGNA